MRKKHPKQRKPRKIGRKHRAKAGLPSKPHPRGRLGYSLAER
jgi:hypothetical protein